MNVIEKFDLATRELYAVVGELSDVRNHLEQLSDLMGALDHSGREALYHAVPQPLALLLLRLEDIYRKENT